MGRRIRMVPENWEHPKKDNGQYQPMFEQPYIEALNEWIAQHNLWEQGKHPDQLNSALETSQYKHFAQWNGNPPDVEYYNTFYSPKECTFVQLYEDTSEGTPKSPVFKTIEEIAEYAESNCTTFANFKTSKENWLKMLKDGVVYHQQGNAMFI